METPQKNSQKLLRDGLTLTEQLDAHFKEKKPIKCKACNDIKFWCRGCGGSIKKEAMKAAGIPDNEIETIYKIQFGGCEKNHVPCYLCNRKCDRWWSRHLNKLIKTT